MLLGVLSIGEFSDLCGLSVKVLRTYGDLGLVSPVAVDPASGYRYYSSDQLPRAVWIAAMRRAGVSLADIAGFLRQPDPARFDQWVEAITAESWERRRALTEARDLWNGGPTMTSTFASGEATHIGGRDRNEDAVLVRGGLYAVADGFGGYPAGEHASRTALDTLDAAFAADPSLSGLVAAVRAANVAVSEGGTTLTAVAVTDDAGTVVAHVGDSRLYRWRRGRLTRLTGDHSVVADLVAAGDITQEEAAGHEQRFLLTRAVGVAPDLQVDYATIEVRGGDRLLLCTDGLHRSVTDTEIAGLLDADPQEAADALVAAALRAGASDNISVVVLAAPTEVGGASRSERESQTAGNAIGAEHAGGMSDGDLSVLDEQISFYRAEAAVYDRWLTAQLDRVRSGVNPEESFRRGRERVAAMLSRLQPHGRALEIAAGTASFSLLVAPHVGELTLLDSSPESLAIARGRLADYGERVSYVKADVFEWTPSNRYDTICFAAWLHHVPAGRFDAFWELVEQALEPGGQVIFDFGDRAIQRPFDRAEIPPVASSAYRVYHRPEQAVTVRDLGGRRWRVVHELWDSDELRTRLAQLGWRVQLETLGWDPGSHWASARRSS